MATITITNLTAADVAIADLYGTLPASGTLTTSRSQSDLANMTALQALIQAGTVSLAIAYTAAEKAAGLVGQGDGAVAASGLSDEQVIRVPFTALAAGTADDVTVFAVNTLPYKKMRIIEAVALISTAIGATTMQVRTAAAAGGTLCAELSSGATGRQLQNNTVTASQVITNGASVGLFIRRSDRGVAGEVFIRVRAEV